MAPMPVADAGSAAALGADGKIYVVGGTSGGVTTDVVQVYNPAANSWTISTPLPEALSASAMGVDSLGRLMVMGGMDTNGNDVGDVWRSQQLGVPDSAAGAHAISRHATATYQAPYTSTITATGNPQPVYLLVSGPAGMTVDYFSGAIHLDAAGARSDRDHSGDHRRPPITPVPPTGLSPSPSPTRGQRHRPTYISLSATEYFGDVGLGSRRPGGRFRNL